MRVFRCDVCGADSHATDEIIVKCDRCGKVIPSLQVLSYGDGAAIRLPLCDEDGTRIREDGEPLWLLSSIVAVPGVIDAVLGAAEEDVVEADRHYCGVCLGFLVEQAIKGMKSGAAWKDSGESDDDDDEEVEGNDDELEAVDA